MRTVPVFATILALVALSAQPAAAHAELEKSVPAAGQQVTAAPESVQLTFGQDVLVLGARIDVVGPSGPVAVGGVRVKGASVSRQLAGEQPNGSYVVTWRVTSDDAHPIDGTFTYLIDAPQGAEVTNPALNPASTAAVAPAAATVAPRQGTSGTLTGGDDQSRMADPEGWQLALIAVVAALAAVGSVIARRRRPPGAGPPASPTG